MAIKNYSRMETRTSHQEEWTDLLTTSASKATQFYLMSLLLVAPIVAHATGQPDNVKLGNTFFCVAHLFSFMVGGRNTDAVDHFFCFIHWSLCGSVRGRRA